MIAKVIRNTMLFTVLIALSFVLSACSTEDAEKNEARISASKLTEQGYQLLDQRQPKAALAIFDQAISGDENNIRALQGKGIALNSVGRHKEAEKIYDKALKIEPESHSVLNNLAMSKILRERYSEALAILTPLAESDPENIKTQDNIALAYCLLGRKEEARKIYSKRLENNQVEENLRFCHDFEEIRTGK